MRMTTGVLLPLALASFTLFACADRKAARIAHDPPPVLTTRGFVPFPATLANKKGEPLYGEIGRSGSPVEILEVASDGRMRCLKSGDATLTLSGRGLIEEVPVKCRVPAEIEVPAEIRLVLKAKPARFSARALGESRAPLPEVAVEVASSDPGVVAVEGGAVSGVAVGRARLESSAGGLTAVTLVEVVERIVEERLTLRDGGKKSWTLKPGDYLVTVDLSTDERLKQGVTITWEGAACAGQPESPSHRARCSVYSDATVTIANPALMGVGATVTGNVGIFRVPASPQAISAAGPPQAGR